MIEIAGKQVFTGLSEIVNPSHDGIWSSLIAT